MRILGAVLVLAACGSSGSTIDQPDFPDDKKLHDLSSETAEAKIIRWGGKQVSLADLPMISGAIGLPMTGTGDVAIDITVPKVDGKPDYARATGSASINCTKCQLGDDKTKLKLGSSKRAAAFVGDGLEFSHLTIDRLDAKVTVGDGKLDLTSWKLSSPDLEVEVSLSMKLATKFRDSSVSGCVRFKATEALKTRDPKMHALLSLTGAMRGADGFEHIQLEGTGRDIRRLARECGPKT